MNFNSAIWGTFEKNRDIIVTWFSVLTRGPKGFEKIDLENSSTLVYALKFMFYMAVVSIMIDLPLAARVGSSFLTGMSVPAALVVEAYLEYLVVGLILFAALKLVGGKGRLQPCLAAYSLLTAYMPLISFLMLPSRMITVPALLRGTDFKEAVTAVAWDQFSAWSLLSFVLSFLLTTVAFVLFFRAIFRQFRILHQLTWLRTAVAFIAGLSVSAIVMALFLEPPLSALYRALAP